MVNAKLDEAPQALEHLRKRRFAQIELTLQQSTKPLVHKARREERGHRDIDEIFNGCEIQTETSC